MLLWQKGQNKRMKITNSRRLMKTGSWTQDFVTGEFQLSNEIFDIFETNQIVSKDLFCFLPFVHTEDKDSVNNALQGAVNGEDYNIEYRIVTAKGNLKYVNERTFTIFDRYKKPVRVIGIIEQIPSKSKDSIGMDKLKRKYELLIRESCDMFALVNDKGQIKYASESLSEVIGYDGSELLGKSIFDIFNTENSIEIKYMIEKVSEGSEKKAEGTFFYTNKNGDNIYLELVIRNVNQKSRNGLIVSFRDITKRVEMEKMVHHISTHDELTGLPNRIHLKETLNKLCNEAKKENNKFATMMLRVDRFNRMLDAIGHYVGDKLLVEVSHRLKYVFGEHHYICRYSEDRYAIIVTD
ncbi:MAG TPA: PAS domain S-box protein, partial [Clostridia bacterium]|nr:PAS domain S-box protein [Clostridia bacterium]